MISTERVNGATRCRVDTWFTYTAPWLHKTRDNCYKLHRSSYDATHKELILGLNKIETKRSEQRQENEDDKWYRTESKIKGMGQKDHRHIIIVIANYISITNKSKNRGRR